MKRYLPHSIATVILLGLIIWRAYPAWSGHPSVVDTQTKTTASSSTHAVIPKTVTSSTATNATVVRVIDGDTLVARMDGASSDITIRFLGINTPETVDPRRPVQCFGKEASNYAKHLLNGQRVRLVADPQADDHDKYERELRTVLLADGTDVNAELVRDGYAYAYLNFPLNKQRKAYLKSLQTQAEMGQRGLWDPQTCNGKP